MIVNLFEKLISLPGPHIQTDWTSSSHLVNTYSFVFVHEPEPPPFFGKSGLNKVMCHFPEFMHIQFIQ